MPPTHLGHGSREGPTIIKPEFFWLAGGGFLVWLVSSSVGGILTTVNLFHLLRKEGREVLGWYGVADLGARYWEDWREG